MKLKIKNVGRINQAEIEINGITVICGNNDTGKSTIGKLLYCIYASLYHLPEQIFRERLNVIVRPVRNYSVHHYYLGDRENIYEVFRSLISNPDLTKENISETLKQVLHDNDEETSSELIEEMTEKIQSYLAVTEKEIVAAFLQRTISAEFGGKLANVNSSTQKADVSLEVKDRTISFHTSGKSQKVEIDQYINLEKRLIYIDDPFILDEVGQSVYHHRAGDTHHRDELISLIRRSVRHPQENVIEGILRDSRLRDVMDKMREVSDGSLVFEDGEFRYRHTGLNENLSLVSVSTGIKTFAILRSLLESGYLEDNGIMVMDEPEVHLHPEWQIRLAEITVLLQKVYGLNIVITTHSIDFLIAIDFYSKKYEIRDNCRFYLTETDQQDSHGNQADVNMVNVTEDMEKMYSSISEPYLKVYSQMEGD